jgi:hypothetical protein
MILALMVTQENYLEVNTAYRVLSPLLLSVWFMVEPLRLLFGYVGNLQEKVPQLTGFWLFTLIPQVASQSVALLPLPESHALLHVFVSSILKKALMVLHTQCCCLHNACTPPHSRKPAHPVASRCLSCPSPFSLSWHCPSKSMAPRYSSPSNAQAPSSSCALSSPVSPLHVRIPICTSCSSAAPHLPRVLSASFLPPPAAHLLSRPPAFPLRSTQAWHTKLPGSRTIQYTR